MQIISSSRIRNNISLNPTLLRTYGLPNPNRCKVWVSTPYTGDMIRCGRPSNIYK
jgi:hypothetical protein